MSAAPALAPEFVALCRLVTLALEPGAESAAAVAALARVGDWNDFVAGAERHRVVALVQTVLGRLPPGALPGEIVARIERLARRNAVRGLAQLGELVRLDAAFAAAGLDVLTLKGLGLSQRLHGDPFRRGVGDIDLLINPNAFAAAHAVLVRLGYVRGDSHTSAAPAATLLHAAKDVGYVHANGQVVELHLTLFEPGEFPRWDFARLWRQRTRLRVQSVETWGLEDGDLTLYLLLHGARHCWDRLCWLADMAVLLRDPALSAQAAAACAEYGLERPWQHCRQLLACWLPASGQEAVTPAGRSALAWFMASFFSGRRWLERPRRGTWPWFTRELRQRGWRLYLAGDWRRRGAAFWYAVRNPVDQAVIPLPRRLVFLYPLLRPLGWVLRNFLRRR